MTGVEVLRQARRLRPDATRLLFTAYADIKAVIDAINQGNVFRYITKPWDPDELETVVRQAVEHHDLIVERNRLLAELKETNRRLVEAEPAQGGVHRGRQPRAEHPGGGRPGHDRALEDDARPSRLAGRAALGRPHPGRRQAAGRDGRADAQARPRRRPRRDPLDLQRDGAGAPGPGRRRRAGPVPRGPRPAGRAGPRPGPRRARGRPGEGRRRPDEPARQRDQVHPRRRHDPRSRPAPTGPDRVRFEVADQGVGIDPAAPAHLFEPFFTGFDTMHHSSGEFQYGKRGIGLGLCLVKTFVELHGGAVDVRAPRAGLDLRLHPAPRRPQPWPRPVAPDGGRRGR